jgi:hypothetical protein
MKMKKVTYACMAIMGLGFGAQTAFADATVVYKMTSDNGGGTQTIRYVDKKHVRVDMDNDSVRHETTMMKLDDKVYMITGKTVQDMDQLTQMMAMMGKKPKKVTTKHSSIKYEDTGRKETIAGITGKVYQFTERGKKHEVVLAQDRDLQAAVLGSMEIAKAMSVAMPDARDMVAETAPIKSMALLRLDHAVQLQSIKRDRISKSVFKLPSKPQQMGGGMGSLMKMMGR